MRISFGVKITYTWSDWYVQLK